MMPQNVAQPYTIYDSVGISCGLDDFGRIPPGWFDSFSAMGQAGDIHFFDMRNKSDTGLPYNNQDSRDLISYGFFLQRISVSFVGPATAEFADNATSTDMTDVQRWCTIEAQNSPIWTSELPQHCGIELRINTDIHLKANVAMIGSAAGGVGGGFGGAMNNTAYTGGSGIDYVSPVAQNVFSTGSPQIMNCWTFPVKIGIPRKAAVSVILKPNEWARNMLQTILGPGATPFLNQDNTHEWFYNLYTIRVALHGIRLLQQRGEYHAG